MDTTLTPERIRESTANGFWRNESFEGYLDRWATRRPDKTAMVDGGGHVLHPLCDLSIASETAVFGQTGPRVGSVDAGHGTGYLARVVGEKKAREIWYLCRQYSAADALAMGLVNKVVPPKDLRAEVEQWCAELLEKSPTALALAKQSFNIDSEPRAGVAQFAHTALGLYYQTEEAMEGRNAFVEKRPVNFAKFRT